MNIVQLLTMNSATSKEKLGGGFIGRIQIGYQELIDLLGNPHFEKSGDGKVDAEWAYVIDRDSKTVVTIYNYKSKGLVKYESDWHIGGHGDHELIRDWVQAVFKQPLGK